MPISFMKSGKRKILLNILLTVFILSLTLGGVFWLAGTRDIDYQTETATGPKLKATVGVISSTSGSQTTTDLSFRPTEDLFPLAAGQVIKPFVSEKSAELIPHQDSKIKVLIMGSDQRSSEDNFRTDVLMLAVVDVARGRVSLLSFPRDLYVILPTGQMGRINNAYALGGFPGVRETLENNFGLQTDYYVLTSFAGFINIIDHLGGLEVNVSRDFSDWRAGQWTVIKAGNNQFDGATALWYARSRETSSDFDRHRRGQEVIKSLIMTILRPENLTRAGDIYQQLKQDLPTNIGLADLVGFLTEAPKLGINPEINRYTFTDTEVKPWTEPGSGAWVLLFDREATQALARRVIGR